MFKPLTIEAIGDKLKAKLSSKRFDIRYGPYTVENGAPAYRGQRDPHLLNAYSEGLETAYAVYRELFDKREPALPIRVLVFHLPDCLSSKKGVPMGTPWGILLSNRSLEVSQQGKLDRARIEAAHELFHVFQLTVGTNASRWAEKWSWIREAAAVFASRHVYPSSSEVCCVYQEWLESPEESLDAQSQQYASSMFIQWYARRFGVRAVADIWLNGKAHDPLDVLESKTSSEGTTLGALFRDYSRDAYFLCEPSSGCYYPALHALWGTREVRKDFSIPRDTGRATAGLKLDHLSTNYFTVHCDCPAPSITFTLAAQSREVRAQIAVVRKDLRRGDVVEFEGTDGVLQAPLPDVGECTAFDHFVITVTNCGRGTENDGVSFTLSAGKTSA